MILSVVVALASITASQASTEYCKVEANVAKKVMTDRQNGKTTIVEALDNVETYLDKSIVYIVNKYDREDAEYYRTLAYKEAEISRVLIPVVYGSRLYQNKEHKDFIINEFSSGLYLDCIKSNRDFY